MLPTITLQVKPRLPSELETLGKLAGNLWFSWNPEAGELFKRIDPRLWDQVQRNPVQLLNQADQTRLETLALDAGFVAQLERVARDLEAYLGTELCPFLKGRVPKDFQVGYFSAEYGLASCLPIYSGGLGMLSGDHLKSASNLNLPFVGVGLAYRRGYFRQYLNQEGRQHEEYWPNDFWNLPMELVTREDGGEITVEVDIEGQKLIARAWRVQVGRVALYLLDAGLETNPPHLQEITRGLYGGDVEMRIRQEILLGIGGVRLLTALGISPSVYHMNEGHSAFASLERIRAYRQTGGLNFDEARQVVAASNCFTTHTPVPAGNDYFPPELVQRHFREYVKDLGISMPVLLGFGRINPIDQGEPFCMTVLALRLSHFRNGVSRLHGRVSRNMWKGIWPHFPEEDVPITAITNGVHIPSWISPDMVYLYDRYLGKGWMEDPDSQGVWGHIDNIPDTELWRAHERRRSRLLAVVRRRLQLQMTRWGAGAAGLRRAQEVLSPEVLTIVFARRFATYKRAVLLLSDPERLNVILNHPDRPVQLIFAGKAHPKDEEGKDFIQRVVTLSQEERFKDRIVFMENYDITLARYLVSGADVWLNTPRRPLEACGTSGMKAAANGVLNLSVLDGWWEEGYRRGMGWAIGHGEEYEDHEYQDTLEAGALYRLLENEVVPLFYQRDDQDLPRGWIAAMKMNLSHLAPVFNSHRMVEDYVDLAYLPAVERHNALSQDDFRGARALGAWARRIMEHWHQVKVLEVECPGPREVTWGDEIEVMARVSMGGLTPGEVAADVYHGPLDAERSFAGRNTLQMEPGEVVDGICTFRGIVTARDTGRVGIRVRITPYHKEASSKHTLGLAAWG